MITRPNTAKPSAILSWFLTNPSHTHIYTANRLIVYLDLTQYRAIRYAIGATPSVDIATNALYRDNLDHKSSTRYLYYMARGPID